MPSEGHSMKVQTVPKWKDQMGKCGRRLTAHSVLHGIIGTKFFFPGSLCSMQELRRSSSSLLPHTPRV